jgi:hypothetical protein
MIEHMITLEKYGHSENKNIFPVKEIYSIPRTSEAWEEKNIIYFDSHLNASVLTRKVENFCLPTLIGFKIEPTITPTNTYMIAWNTLNERGFNVVPSVRKVDENIVATTNLAADNITSIYDQKIDIAEIRDTFPMDRAFVKIPFEKIKNEAMILLNHSNKFGVELMSDGPFHIVVKQDGSWYLILLDIGKVKIYSESRKMPNSSTKDNRFYIDRALRAYSKIQQNILSLRNARGLT